MREGDYGGADRTFQASRHCRCRHCRLATHTESRVVRGMRGQRRRQREAGDLHPQRRCSIDCESPANRLGYAMRIEE
jgi:hypothetical protein